MEKLVSSFTNVKSLPADFILPPELRAGEEVVPISMAIPVIDLEGADAKEQILKAGEEFGFFQVINHGIPDGLVKDMMSVVKEFFEMPAEDRADLYSEDPNKVCRLSTSVTNYHYGDVHFWRDNLRHFCLPLEEYLQFWPKKPLRYREVVGESSVEVMNLAWRILEMICEGLGLDAGYFGGEQSKVLYLSVNHYPRCPEPSLTLGIPKHGDPNLITILHQGDVYGLQVFKDGKWIGVEPIANAFVVNMGYQLQIISNGKLKSTEHRVVPNSSQARTSAGFFIGAPTDSIIEPAKALVNKQNPPLYKAIHFKEFLAHYFSVQGDVEATLSPFKLEA